MAQFLLTLVGGPPAEFSMKRVHDLTVDLAKAGKTFKEIQETVEKAYPGNALSRSAVYNIIKTVKEGKDAHDKRGLASTKIIRTPDFIEAIRTDIEEDRRRTVSDLVARHDASRETIHKVLTEDLGLSKKSARWVPKLLNDSQKRGRVESSRAFIKRFHEEGNAFLDKIVTMDESAVAYHTPETKQQSKQWVKKGTPGPLKCKSQSSRIKQMVLCFFDNEGLIYTNVVPKGTMVNAAYIIDVLGRFLKKMREKRPTKLDQGFIFHWDNAPVHTASSVQEFLAKKNVELLQHPAYSPDLAPADYFLFPKMKSKLAGKFLDSRSFKKEWDGVASTLTRDDFLTAFKKWVDRHIKCISIDGSYVEKC